LIHAAFKDWFDIDVTSESSDRHPAQALQAMTPEAERELHPKKLNELLHDLAVERIARARQKLSELPRENRRRQLQADWARLLGNVAPPAEVKSRSIVEHNNSAAGFSIERVVLTVESSISFPILLLKSEMAISDQRHVKPKVVVALAQSGKQRLLPARAAEIATFLASGLAVCLPDLRGMGETSLGTDRGRRSAATSASSSELMLGGTMLGAQVRDLRAVLVWLRGRDDLETQDFAIWGDSLSEPNPPDTIFQVPRDDDEALPRSSEPLGGLLALLTALYEQDVRAVYVHGGLASFESVLAKHLVLIPHDVVVPGALTAGDLCDLVAAITPCRVRLEEMVDGWNRRVSLRALTSAYEPAAASYRTAAVAEHFSFSAEGTSVARWLTDGKPGRAR